VGNHSLPQAKNFVERTLRKAVDPDPSRAQIDEMKLHFKWSCAYCGRDLKTAERKSHVDHLDAVGHRNHISNRVLSCDICNGDEKREQNWEQFLGMKCGSDADLRRERSQRIIDWQVKCGNPQAIDKEVAEQVKQSVYDCCAMFEEHYKRLRSMRKISNPETPKL
jgi:hypothetical protein